MRPRQVRRLCRHRRYLDNSDGMGDAVARFAATYPEQTDRDYDLLVKAAKASRIRVAKVAA